MSWTTYLFGLTGRVNRAKLWLLVLISIVAQMVLNLMMVATFGTGALVSGDAAAAESGPGVVVALVSLLLGLVLFVASVTLGIRRLHDRNKSGWWLLPFWILPALLFGGSGALALLEPNFEGLDPNGGVLILGALGLWLWGFVELYCVQGTVGENSYGLDPLDPDLQAKVFV